MLIRAVAYGFKVTELATGVYFGHE